MTDYPDTSFLCALYRDQTNSREAETYWATIAQPLPFTSLLEFEFLQAIRFQVFLHEADRTKGYALREADRMISDWESDVAAGLMRQVPFEVEAVTRLAASFSSMHTPRGGHRSFDLLHLATAVHLGAGSFLTFDTRQRKLARHIGLKTPL